MNEIRLNLFILATSVAAFFTACSSAPLHLATSSKIPAATGDVMIGDAGNDNTSIALNVKYLAPPQRVSAAATTYVVWLRPLAPVRNPAGGTLVKPSMNLGALKVDQRLNGNLETVTPYREFELFVTAEPSPTAAYPTGSALLWTTVKR